MLFFHCLGDLLTRHRNRLAVWRSAGSRALAPAHPANAGGFPHHLARLALLGFFLIGSGTGSALAASDGASSLKSDGGNSVGTVQVDGRSLFRVVGISAFPADRRARLLADQIEKFAENRTLDVDQIKVVEAPDFSTIELGTTSHFIVLDADAALEGVRRQVLTQVIRERVVEVVQQYRVERESGYLLKNAGFAAGATMLVVLLLWGARRMLKRVAVQIESRYRRSMGGLRIDSFQIIEEEQLWSLVRSTFLTLWWLLALGLCYGYLEQVLSRFPWTRGFASSLIRLVIEPLERMTSAFLHYIPDLVFLLVLVVLVRYLLKLTRFFFLGVAHSTVKVAGFEGEWAMPTYALVRVCIVAFALVIAFPYLPGSNSDAFKGISVFLGVLLSIGSSTIIGNVMAGYSLLYRRAFRVGDVVQIGKNVGEIAAIRQQVTILRTPKNEEIIIPNSMILNTEITNFSIMAREGRLVLHSSVTIGYDTPWRQVEAMLIEGARRTEGLLTSPVPFVHQRSLGDFYVDYEINAFCDNAGAVPELTTRLHRNILDVFNEFGVQIMSPHFEVQPQAAVLVPKEQWYAAPAASASPDRNGR